MFCVLPGAKHKSYPIFRGFDVLPLNPDLSHNAIANFQLSIVHCYFACNMPVALTKTFRFEAAHFLPTFAEGHKCRRMHGHSFRVEIKVKGEIDPVSGILVDFGDIKAVVKPIIDGLDHYCLNELGKERNEALLLNPTSENLAKWLFRTIKPKLKILSSIVVHETCTSLCEYWEE